MPGTGASAMSSQTASFEAPPGPSAARRPACCSLPLGMFLESSFLSVPPIPQGEVCVYSLALPPTEPNAGPQSRAGASYSLMGELRHWGQDAAGDAVGTLSRSQAAGAPQGLLRGEGKVLEGAGVSAPTDSTADLRNKDLNR